MIWTCVVLQWKCHVSFRCVFVLIFNCVLCVLCTVSIKINTVPDARILRFQRANECAIETTWPYTEYYWIKVVPLDFRLTGKRLLTLGGDVLSRRISHGFHHFTITLSASLRSPRRNYAAKHLCRLAEREHSRVAHQLPRSNRTI